MDDWNDARLVLAVFRTGSLTAAAKALRVDHSTVFRRLTALEARLGVARFERAPGGVYQPTATGGRAALAAERMEDEALGLVRDLAGQDRRAEAALKLVGAGLSPTAAARQVGLGRSTVYRELRRAGADRLTT